MYVTLTSSPSRQPQTPDHAARARRPHLHVASSVRASGHKALRVDICRPSELGASEIAQWHDFQACSGLEDPFLSPEFARIIGEVASSARVAIVHDGPDLVGYLPFMAHRFGVGRSLGGFIANQHAFIPSGVDWSLERVLRAAGIEVFDFARHVASQRPRGGTLREFSVPVIDLSGGYDAFLAVTRERHRKFVASLLRRRRLLERDDPDLSFEFATHDLAAVATLCEWKIEQERRAGQPLLHSQPVVREVMERVVASRDPAMSGCVSCLRSGDRLLSVYLDIRSTTVFAGWMTGFDASRSADSPGSVALLCLIEAVAGSGQRLFNLGPGQDDYKRRLASGAIAAIEGTLGSRTLRHRIVRRLERTGDPLV